MHGHLGSYSTLTCCLWPRYTEISVNRLRLTPLEMPQVGVGSARTHARIRTQTHTHTHTYSLYHEYLESIMLWW